MKMKHILAYLSIIIIIGALSGCVGKSADQSNVDKYQDVENNTAGTYTQGLKNISGLQETSSGIQNLKFLVVGDPHVKSSSVATGGNARLTQIVNYADTTNVDFIVFLGDMADDGRNNTFHIVKKILKNLTVPYYVVIGNHDIYSSPNNFEANFGPMEHIEHVKDYQLLFAGMWNETNTIDPNTHGKVLLHWSFNFDSANKSEPTLVFLHGPTIGPPPDCIECKWDKFFGYAFSMQPELDKFPNLMGVFSGHVHYDSDQTVKGVRHVTVNGLISTSAGGINAEPSDYIGLVTIKDSKLDYGLIPYNQ